MGKAIDAARLEKDLLNNAFSDKPKPFSEILADQPAVDLYSNTKKITNAAEIEKRGIDYCRRSKNCKTCPLHICIDHHGHIRVSRMAFADFVRDYNLMISEIYKE